MEGLPTDAFLAAYADDIQTLAAQLRAVVRRAVPDAVERVRVGWRLIGYDVPVGGRRKPAYFAYVAPEPRHVHLGFEYGILVPDRDRRLEGAHLNLRKVRYVTYRPGDEVPEPALERLTVEAARVASLSREERLALILDRPDEEASTPWSGSS